MSILRRLRSNSRYLDARVVQVLANFTRPSRLEYLKPILIKNAIESGYVGWPRKISQYLWNKEVLDVGCGHSLHFVGFSIFGVKSYTGVDPTFEDSRDWVKSKRTGERFLLGDSIASLTRGLSWVRFINAQIPGFSQTKKFDVVVMHNVTEHILDLAGAMAEIARILKPGGILILHHHNFFAWDGHHRFPRNESELESAVIELGPTDFSDWKHVYGVAKDLDWPSMGLNRVSLDELKSLVQENFSVLDWKEIVAPLGKGGGRFQLIEKNDALKKIPERDLKVKNIFCVARLGREP